MASDDTLTLCVFIDAFGWELVQRYPFLDDLLAVKAPLQTVLGYSCTCDPTILTGQMPVEHGHFSFFAYSPERSPFGRTLLSRSALQVLGMLPTSLTSRGRVRHQISKAFKKALGFTGYFQLYNVPFHRLALFDYTERRDLYLPEGINSGSPTIFDKLRDSRTPFFCSDWRKGEEDCLADLSAALAAPNGRPRFAYLYLAAMDALLHAEGTQSPRVGEKIAWYDRRLRELLNQAKRVYPGGVRLHLFSDHGMTDITEVCDLMGRIEKTGLTFAQDYAAVYDSTMARFWFLRPGARETITHALEGEPRGHILSDTELEDYGCRFSDQRYGEMFFLLNPGVLLCPSFMGESPLAGMHGYAPEDPASTAMFASSVPAADLPILPHRLDDLYALMYADAGLGLPSRSTGSVSVAAAGIS